MNVNLDTRRSVLSDLIECSFMRMLAHPNCKYLVFNIVQGKNCLVARFLFELWEYPTGIRASTGLWGGWWHTTGPTRKHACLIERTKRSAKALHCGTRGGQRTILTPADSSVCRKPSTYFVSRSMIRGVLPKAKPCTESTS